MNQIERQVSLDLRKLSWKRLFKVPYFVHHEHIGVTGGGFTDHTVYAGDTFNLANPLDDVDFPFLTIEFKGRRHLIITSRSSRYINRQKEEADVTKLRNTAQTPT